MDQELASLKNLTAVKPHCCSYFAGSKQDYAVREEGTNSFSEKSDSKSLVFHSKGGVGEDGITS